VPWASYDLLDAGGDHAVRLAELTESQAAAQTEREGLENRWKQEAALVGEIRKIRGQLVPLKALAEGDGKTAAPAQPGPAAGAAPAAPPRRSFPAGPAFPWGGCWPMKSAPCWR
jgi:hypothetical protein